MRVLIFHGYLLDGTGSNVYNARLAAALVALGHEVHLLSQDRHPERQPFVDAFGDWDGGTLSVRDVDRPAGEHPHVPGAGRCTAYRPDIGGLLPVYVADRYEGIAARTFAQLSEQELARYIDANVAAVAELLELVRPQVALANHLVMGPVILARGLRGEVPYAVKVHGSALEYTVKPQPERFLPLAREGLAGASAVLVGSRHTAVSLWEAIGERGSARSVRGLGRRASTSRASPRAIVEPRRGRRAGARGEAACRARAAASGGRGQRVLARRASRSPTRWRGSIQIGTCWCPTSAS